MAKKAGITLDWYYEDQYGRPTRRKTQIGDKSGLALVASYTDAIREEVVQAAIDIQASMRDDLERYTPIRGEYGNTFEKRKYPPGTMKRSWRTVECYYNGHGLTIFRKNSESGQYEKCTVYAVRNTKRACVVHLVNWGHDINCHGKYRGRVGAVTFSGDIQIGGKGFVTTIQEAGMAALDKEIKRIISRR